MNIDNLQQAIINNITSRLASGLPSPMRLRDLIRQIRAARTAADERAVVQKECAYIRSTFREEDNVWRCRNVAKLLYIHMLGYPAHFGQLECLKLIASPRFTDKRIGYLGAMLLLDERQDVHLLITNSLKTDLNSPVQFVVGLALCALGAICSPEMCRDLAGEIERLMKSSNTYIRKKATLCAARIVRRVPELMEMFLPASRSLLTEKNHAVLVTGITLITEMCEQSPDTLNYFKKKDTEQMTGNLVRILKNLIMAGYSPEHDVCGVSDPFLQVKILRLLRLLGRNDAESSEAMTDILAQVATNTESSKNVGNAILYETVLTIMAIKSETGLRVLGVNILGRFLLNTDKNIRYVALQTLQKTVQADYNAVQRHRSTIVECLKDADPSIRKKAMELCFTLMNSNNIKTMTKELLSFLEKADPEFKAVCSSNLCTACEQFSPGAKWHIDCMIHILKTAGNYVRDDVVGSLIHLISDSPTLHSYSVHTLWSQVSGDLQSKQPLVQVACWVLGEFADRLLTPCPEIQSEQQQQVMALAGESSGVITNTSTNSSSAIQVTEEQVVSLLERILSSHHLTIVTKEYALQSLMKVSVRFPDQTPRIKSLTDSFSSHLNTELQQRATEFSCLFRKYDNLRPSVLERMPAMKPADRKGSLINGGNNGQNGHVDLMQENQQQQAVNGLTDNSSDDLVGLDSSPVHLSSTNTNTGISSKYDALVDIMGLDLSSGPTPASSSNTTTSVADVLSLFDQRTPSSANPASTLVSGLPDSLTPNDSLLGLGNNSFNLDSFLSSPSPPAGGKEETQPDQMLALNKNGLKVVFTFDKRKSDTPDHTVTISMRASNSSPFPMSDFLFQAAVPKSFSLQLLPPDTSTIGPNGSLTQGMNISNPNNNQLRMRIKISYVVNGKPVNEQTEINNFPPELWS